MKDFSLPLLLFEIVQVYLLPAVWRMYKGRISGKMSGKNYLSNKFFCILSPVFSSHINYTLFVEIPRYLEVPLIDFCKTSHSRRQAPKVYVA